MPEIDTTAKIIEVVTGAAMATGGASGVTIFFVKKYFAALEAKLKELSDFVRDHHTDIAILKDRQNAKQRQFYRPGEKKRD